MPISIKCGKCNLDIDRGEELYCQECMDEKDDKINSLEAKIEELEDEVTKLKDELDELQT